MHMYYIKPFLPPFLQLPFCAFWSKFSENCMPSSYNYACNQLTIYVYNNCDQVCKSPSGFCHFSII